MECVQTGPAQYRFRLEFWRPDGPCLAEVPLGPADFDRAVEAAFFDALRRGRFAEYAPPRQGVRIEPRFTNDDGGSPRTRGFEVVVPTPDGAEHRMPFGVRFFAGQTRRALRQLGEATALLRDGALLFHLAAYLDEAAGAPEPAAGITLGPPEVAVPIRPGSRKALGPTEAWDGPSAEDVPVLVPRRVLDDALAEARRAPDREVGGLLLGHLRRDAEAGDLFVEVTCHVPAEGTTATDVSVTFTSATWARAREVARLRGEGEVFVGWAHSHPFLLEGPCPEPLPEGWPDELLFFSAEDRFLMELTFPRPFMVGLQTGLEPRLEQALGHAPVRLYGWRKGAIVARGFEVFDD